MTRSSRRRIAAMPSADRRPSSSGGNTGMEYNPHLLDIALKFGGHVLIRARFTSDGHVDFLGYKVESASSPLNGQWFEFGRSSNASEHRIPGSTFLDMSFDYDDLEKQLEGEDTLSTIKVGRKELKRAAETLARAESRKERARALVVVGIMVREGARFNAVVDYVSKAKVFNKGAPLPAELISLVRENHYHSFEDVDDVRGSSSSCSTSGRP